MAELALYFFILVVGPLGILVGCMISMSIVGVLRVSNLDIITVGWNFQGLALGHSGSKLSPGSKNMLTGSGANPINSS